MNKTLFYGWLAWFVFFTFSAHGQLPDSIQKKLTSASHDTSRVRILINCCKTAAENDSLIPLYATSAIELIDKNHGDAALKNMYLGYKVDALIAAGKYFVLMRGDSKKGVPLINESASIARMLNDKQRLANAYSAQQDVCAITSDLPRLRSLIDSTIPLQTAIHDQKGLVNSYCNLGNYYNGIGNSDSAIASFIRAESFAAAIKDRSMEATMQYAIGFSYMHKGNPRDALPYLYKSVKTCSDAGKPDDAYQAIQALGNVYNALDEFSKAISFFDSAIVLAKKKSDIYSLCSVYFYKGGALKNLQKFDSSDYYLEKSIDLSRQINFRDMLSAAYTKIGSNYFENGNHDKALGYFRKSLDENREAQLPEDFAENYSYIGLIMLEQNNPDSAFYYAQLAKKYTDSLQFNTAHRQLEFLFSKVYEQKGDYKNALKAYKNFVAYSDSVNNQRTFRSAVEKQYEYETEKKDLIAKAAQEKKDIEIKAQKNRLFISIISFVIILFLIGTVFYINRKRKETLYRQNLAESEMKALRAQMNPHFLFNSLNAIQQMVLNNENDNAFRYLDTYSKLTRRILENSEKKWIPLQDEIKFLELYLQIESLRFEHAFRYEIKTGKHVSVHTDRIPAMIVQPLVENAIKHGLLNKAGDKKLLIAFDKPGNNGQLEVIVEDNGIGREVSGNIKGESDHQSMSLSITENRLRLLDEDGNSKIIIEDLKENGTGKTS
ncbi:MAG TPA: histidine kinase, partial [Cyclobacteriaceae bacterium]|nr:histidine kinase [Cyclobacteriaceae bacterium]